MPGSAAAQAQGQPTAKPSRVTLAYFGESVTNPGAGIGYDAAFYYKRPHELFGAARIGGYHSADPALYGLFLYLEGGYRLNFTVGFFLEARIGLGYVNVNRSGTTQTQSDGSSVLSPNVNVNYLSPLGLAGLGWDLLPRAHVPLSFFALAGGMGRYNQQEPFTGGLVFTAGLAYQFGTRKPRSIELPVPSPPPAMAPPGPDSGLPPGVVPDQPPPAAAPPVGPAEQAPPELPPPPTFPAGP